MPQVTVIGAGLAGCEAAWQLAERGVHVRLVEMKPLRRTEAQVSDNLAELVCSNSLRSRNPLNAVGLLKEEMRRLGSLIIDAAIAAQVPAGDALAVERERFAAEITSRIDGHPRITLVREVVTALPTSGDTIVATGPLTAAELAADIGRVSGRERLAFYDAIAPIVSGDSLDHEQLFARSRYGKGDGDDYLNVPLDAAQYEAFVDAILAGEHVPLHDFESARYFEGCLPIEVVASRGRDALRFGCMKPVGLEDPETGERPYAVIQLRREDPDGQAYNLVGFQTKLKYPDQQRILRALPGLAGVEFLRLGAVHRNTYLDSPNVLDARMRLVAMPNVRFAGQITGVEGYVESAAHGLVTALVVAGDVAADGARASLEPPPRGCALGALWGHVTGAHRIAGRPHEPQNVNWALFPPPAPGTRKADVKRSRVLNAVAALEAWAAAQGLALRPGVVDAASLPVAPKRRRRRRAAAQSGAPDTGP